MCWIYAPIPVTVYAVPSPKTDALAATDPVDYQKQLKKIKKASWALYRRQCWSMTNTALPELGDISSRAWRGEHIDHIVPISQGYKLGIPPELVGGAGNLRLIPAKMNLTKGTRLTEESKKILKVWGY